MTSRELARALYACTMRCMPKDAVGYDYLHPNTRKMYENQADYVLASFVPRCNELSPKQGVSLLDGIIEHAVAAQKEADAKMCEALAKGFERQAGLLSDCDIQASELCKDRADLMRGAAAAIREAK